jgi:hypothetical protein
MPHQKNLRWRREKSGERREQALYQAPGYSIGYEKLDLANSLMWALKPALPFSAVLDANP